MKYPVEVIEVKEEQRKKLWAESEKLTDDDIEPDNWSKWSNVIKRMVHDMTGKVRTELSQSEVEKKPIKKPKEKEEASDDDENGGLGSLFS